MTTDPARSHESPQERLPVAYRRRATRVVRVGTVGIGGDEPIRVQSMTTTDTGDTEATALQAKALADAGCEIVRVTVPNMADAATLPALRRRLEELGVATPLVADIHFNPHAALAAADCVEKVRINPGNYADAKKFAVREYSDDEYAREIDRIREKFAPLVEKCKRLGRAMRIGTNHGSLSDRIMNRHGDTPLGMVESALEFLRICRDMDYHDVVLSMKSSNAVVAIQAYRLLADRLDAEGMDHPFHLGVTEAGDGEDGRVKSAIGIGALLADGIGDTIRVSLTEDPVREVPVARALVRPYNEGRAGADDGPVEVGHVEIPRDGRRATEEIRIGSRSCGGSAPPCVFLEPGRDDGSGAAEDVRELVAPPGSDAPLADAVFAFDLAPDSESSMTRSLAPALWDAAGRLPYATCTSAWDALAEGVPDIVRRAAGLVMLAPGMGRGRRDWATRLAAAARGVTDAGLAVGLLVNEHGPDPSATGRLPERLARSAVAGVRAVHEATGRLPLLAILPPPDRSPVHAVRMACALLETSGLGRTPILLVDVSARDASCDPLLEGAARMGGLLADGIGDGLLVLGGTPRSRVERALGILQVMRLRMTRPDYIACPSCGRTLFDLEEVTARIKGATSHLKGVKIAIMGCIVNGPGEMADADFGYVGSAPGKINLYVGKDCVEKNIPMAEADRRLIELIREHGRWVEPPVAARTG